MLGSTANIEVGSGLAARIGGLNMAEPSTDVTSVLPSGVPPSILSSIDEQRNRARHQITVKLRWLEEHGIILGEPTGPLRYRSGIDAWVRRYRVGLIMYHDSHGVAFEIHGSHFAAYSNMAANRSLGYLVSDEGPAGVAGTYKTLFSSGGIYSSDGTPPLPVVGMIYLAYEAMGEARAVGLPTTPERVIPGGLEQEFERARLYYQVGAPWAHEVHGDILATYLAAGGPLGLGFPITDVNRSNGGEVSEFEHAAVYSRAGTFIVTGHFRRKYAALGGPAGELGFPISGEGDIPGVAGGRYMRFEHGTLLSYGTYSSMILVRPFRIFLGRVNTDESDPWPGQGANDIYLRITLRQGSTEVFSGRVPQSGDWSTGSNIVDVDYEIPVTLYPAPNENVTLQVSVFDSDTGRDDHLGKWVHTLTASDGWGLGTNNGIFKSGSFDEVNSITAAHQPQVPLDQFDDVQLFWGVKNQGTESLTYSQYAEAFTDVDNDSDSWDPTDWLDRAFYELVVQHLAEPGNCVGLSVESIYSRKGTSIFSQPLERFTDWETIRRQVNVRHCYQVGAPAIYWYLGQVITGNTHDPRDVYRSSEAAFASGNNPVLCLAQNYNFTGENHCVLPVGWDDSKKPWEITISDPNDPRALRTLTVDSDKNTFVYEGTNRYAGGEWTGGRLFYIPFSTVSDRPRTPVWDAVVLILKGTMLLLGSDATTSSITDDSGNDLDSTGDRALAQLQLGRRLDGFFVPVRGFDGSTPILGEMYFRHSPLDLGPSNSRGAQIVRGRRNPYAAAAPGGGSYRQVVDGYRSGAFNYLVKHGLSQFRLSSEIGKGDRAEVDVHHLGSNNVFVGLRTNRERNLGLQVDHKLGVRGDRVSLSASNLPTIEEGLDMVLRPGFGGVDLVPKRKAMVGISLEYTVNGRASKRDFRFPIEEGARFDLASLTDDGGVRVYRIHEVSGPAQGPATIV
jgi:hypothetical protein